MDPGLGSGSFEVAMSQSLARVAHSVDPGCGSGQLPPVATNSAQPSSLTQAAYPVDLGSGSGQHPPHVVTTRTDLGLGSLSIGEINKWTPESPQSRAAHTAKFSTSSQDLGLGSERKAPLALEPLTVYPSFFAVMRLSQVMEMLSGVKPRERLLE